MNRSLRTELLISHLSLVGLMLLLLLASVLGFFRLGRSVDRILRDNYKSVVAAQNMKEALEREDSAATFYLAGQKEKAIAQYRDYRPNFEAAYAIESGNITEEGEQAVANEIKIRDGLYRRHIEQLLYSSPPMSDEAANKLYFGMLEPEFVALKALAQQVLELNQAAIVRADERAKAEARRSTAISVTVTTGATVLALLFAYRMVNAMMTPLVSLTRQAEEIGAGHLNQRIEVRRDDEIGTLASTFNEMAERLRAARVIEEERLHRAERMSDAALENLYDPVIVTDGAGNIVHLNRAAEGLFGPEEQARGKAAREALKEERLVHAIERAVSQEKTSAEEGDAALISFKSGSEVDTRIYRLRANPMHDDVGSRLGAVAVLEDVTYQQEVDRLKTEFVGVASHELRTPVTSLLLGVQLLQEGAVGALSPMQQEVTDALRQDLQRLERMMRDLLDITRLEAGATPPRFEVVPPADLIESARQAVQSQANAKRVRLDTEIPDALPLVRADRGQIGRVLINLLNNAIRHTPEGGSILLRGEAGGGDTIRFSVTDTGTGIPPEYLNRIFERFVQVPGATRGGAGLGLSLAQGVVKAHGGTIRAENNAVTGSRFSFTLPVLPGGETGTQE